MCYCYKENNKVYYEIIFYVFMFFNLGLVIVFICNMINNLGVMVDFIYFVGFVYILFKGYCCIFIMKWYEVEFFFKYFCYVIENVVYKKVVYCIMGWGYFWIKIGCFFEELFLNLWYGNFFIIIKVIKNRINKWLKRD